MNTIRYRKELWKILPQTNRGLLGNVAEIGVAEGNFSEDMLKWPVPFEHLYMVDRWRCVPTQKGDGGHPQSWHEVNFDAVRRRICKYGERAIILRGDSADMAKHVPDKSLALAYIDCDHSYAGVMRDMEAWLPKVMPKGFMAFHDYEAPQYGVKEAVHDFTWDRFTIQLLPEDKPEDAGAYFQVI